MPLCQKFAGNFRAAGTAKTIPGGYLSGKIFGMGKLVFNKKRTPRRSKTERWGVLFLLVLVFQNPLFSQRNPSNLREKTIETRQPKQLLDSLTVAQPIISIEDEKTAQPIDLQFFKIQNNLIFIDTARLRAAHPTVEKVKIRYRVLPFDFGKTVQRLDTAAIRRKLPGGEDYIGYDYSPFEPQKSIFSGSGLTTNGAYTRGLSFGNAQNLNFNSNLNLQLDGKIADDIELRAAISDNSIPLQPDGTTRQLQEFDRIFIQLKKKNASLTAGDFDLTPNFSSQNTNSSTHFLRYFKRVQGATADARGTTRRLPNFKSLVNVGQDTLAGKISAAVSKGKFNRQTIIGQEGNQGPYRLQGAENEQFIIILAGTERVFLDGKLLRRGLQDDYFMDYNLGELTFTPRNLITKDKRVIIEFEYAVQNYLRSTATAGAMWQHGKSRLNFQAYSEQDSRNAGPAQDLQPVERQQLAVAGDNLRTAFASGVDTLENFDPARVLYVFSDTFSCGQPVQILKYSASSDARLAVRFSQVGQGQGNYRQVSSAANGRVFQWVAPDPTTCQPTGNFEPIVRLIAPEQRQMFTLSADFQPFKSTFLKTEGAWTRRDLNRFSPLDDKNNDGAGVSIDLRQIIFSEKKDTAGNGWQADFLGNYEFVSQQFNPLNPYRSAEFSRDWNVGFASDAPAAEHLARAAISLKNKDLGAVRYDFGAFVQPGNFEGLRHTGQVDFKKNGFDFLGEMNFLTTNSEIENTRFSRPKFDFSKTFFWKKSDSLAVPKPAGGISNLKIGVYFEREKNERTAPADTLNLISFWYDVLKFYFEQPENQRGISLGGSVLQRDDYFPTGKNFTKNTSAREANVMGSWKKIKEKNSQSVALNFTVRDLDILEPDLTKLTPQRTFLGRLDHSISAFSNAVSMTTGYEISSGQSPKTEFQYVFVNPGEGQYAWVDRNQDSILQVDEMEIAVFQDQANYIRVATTTTDFIRTNNTALNYNLRLEPRLFWRTSKGFRKFLGRFSEQSVLQILRRVRADAAGISGWNPLDFSVADSALVTISATSRHSIFFNRANPRWDMSLTFSDLKNRLALTTGFENRTARDFTWHGRVSLAQKFSLENDLVFSKKTSDHDIFANRRYDFSGWQIEPKLTWLPNRFFRFSLNFAGIETRNVEKFGGEIARQNNLGFELNWNPAGKTNPVSGFRAATSLRLRGTFADIKFDGQANSAVGYAMLEGLQNGQNFLWSAMLNRQISKDIQLSIGYDGRRTAVRTVHSGQAQVRANF